MSRARVSLLQVCLAAVLASFPVAAQTVEQAIAAANRNYERLVNTTPLDAAALGAQYTADAYAMVPEIQLVAGRDAIVQAFVQTAGQIKGLKLNTTQVRSSGNVAYEVGTWTSTISGRNTIGNYINTWRQVGGAWKRSGGCSVPQNGANPLIFPTGTKVFEGAKRAPAQASFSEVGEARLIGNSDVWATGASVNDLMQQLAAIFNSGDVEGFHNFAMNLYTSDAIVMLPEASPLMGSGSIVAACDQTILAGIVSNLFFGTLSIESGLAGDMAFGLAGYQNDVRAEGAVERAGGTGMVSAGGNYLSIWTKVGGQWKLAGSCTANTDPTPEIGLD